MEPRIKRGEARPATDTLLALGELAPDTEKAKIASQFLTMESRMRERTESMKPRPGNVGPAQALRERILSVSLFPDIYSKNPY